MVWELLALGRVFVATAFLLMPEQEVGNFAEGRQRVTLVPIRIRAAWRKGFAQAWGQGASLLLQEGRRVVRGACFLRG